MIPGTAVTLGTRFGLQLLLIESVLFANWAEAGGTDDRVLKDIFTEGAVEISIRDVNGLCLLQLSITGLYQTLVENWAHFLE